MSQENTSPLPPPQQQQQQQLLEVKTTLPTTQVFLHGIMENSCLQRFKENYPRRLKGNMDRDTYLSRISQINNIILEAKHRRPSPVRYWTAIGCVTFSVFVLIILMKTDNINDAEELPWFLAAFALAMFVILTLMFTLRRKINTYHSSIEIGVRSALDAYNTIDSAVNVHWRLRRGIIVPPHGNQELWTARSAWNIIIEAWEDSPFP